MESKKEFKQFQEYFKKYQQLFGLIGYKVYFKYESLNGSTARILVSQESMTATVWFNSKPSDDAKPFRDIKQIARHEAIHLLLGRLDNKAGTTGEITEAVEELANKLAYLIKG